jgi:hypothetical protein
MKFLSRSIVILAVIFLASFAQAQPFADMVRVNDQLLEVGGEPMKGKVVFVIYNTASGPRGIVAPKSSKTVELDSTGRFDTWLFASDRINPIGYYYVSNFPPNGAERKLGVYKFNYSTTVQTLAINRVIETNLDTRIQLADRAAQDSIASTAGGAGGAAGAAAAQAALASNLTDGAVPKWDAAQGKFISALSTANSLLLGQANGSASWVNINSILFPNSSTPVIQGIPLTGSNSVSGAIVSSSTVDAGTPITSFASLPATPTTARRFFVNSAPSGVPRDTYEYNTTVGLWIPQHGGVFLASYYSSGSTTFGIQEAYNAMGVDGGTVLLDRDLVVTSPIVINVEQLKNFDLDLNGHCLTSMLTAGGALLHINLSTPGIGGHYTVRNGKLYKGNRQTGVTAVKAGFSIAKVTLEKLFIDDFRDSGNIGVHLDGCIDCALDHVYTFNAYRGVVLENECNDVQLNDVKVNAFQAYAAEAGLTIKGSVNVQAKGLLVQSTKSLEAIRIESTSTLPVGGIIIEGFYLENNGTGSTDDTQIGYHSATGQPIRNVTFLAGKLSSGAGNLGSAMKNFGVVDPASITSIGVNWASGGFAKGLFEGFTPNTYITRIGEINTDNDSAQVEINPSNGGGITYGGQGAGRKYRTYAGYPGDFNNYFLFYDVTGSRKILAYNGSDGWALPWGINLRGYSDQFGTLKWQIDSSNGQGDFGNLVVQTSGAVNAFVAKDSTGFETHRLVTTGTTKGHLNLYAPTGQGAGAGINFTSEGGTKNGSFQLDNAGNMVFRANTPGAGTYFDYQSDGIIYRDIAGGYAVNVKYDGASSSTQAGMLLRHDGTLKRVKVGAADSGGTGQRLLTVDN